MGNIFRYKYVKVQNRPKGLFGFELRVKKLALAGDHRIRVVYEMILVSTTGGGGGWLQNRMNSQGGGGEFFKTFFIIRDVEWKIDSRNKTYMSG